IGDRRAVEPLILLLSDWTGTALAAAEALAKLGDPQAIPPIAALVARLPERDGGGWASVSRHVGSGPTQVWVPPSGGEERARAAAALAELNRHSQAQEGGGAK
ncbi:MAG: hypothetical protein HYU66_10035, partial [Armatimonadetes bacterium]|nr:hypothetical protein [Armatimonadota bacterium]